MLEIVVSVLYFVNKVFLLLEKKTGWLVGIMASGLAAMYFFFLKFYIFLSLEFGCLVIMVFGLVGSKKTPLVSNMVYGIISLVMLYLLVNIEESGFLEFVTSISFIFSFLFLARDKWNLGWSFLAFSHSLMLYILWGGEQYFFAIMQGLSVIVCVAALIRKSLRDR